jgi:hypothetical protein
VTLDDNLRAMLAELGYADVRELADGRVIATASMMYTTGLFVGLDPTGYAYRYCYARRADARRAVELWDGAGDAPGPWIVRKGLGADLQGTQMDDG